MQDEPPSRAPREELLNTAVRTLPTQPSGRRWREAGAHSLGLLLPDPLQQHHGGPPSPRASSEADSSPRFPFTAMRLSALQRPGQVRPDRSQVQDQAGSSATSTRSG
jgi:hypothetical protein